MELEQLFAELQSLIKRTDITALNAPTGVTISAGGTYFINFSRGAPSMCTSIPILKEGLKMAIQCLKEDINA